MPTPEEVVIPPSPPAETTISSRASFASCPPEEDRDYNAPREERIQGSEVDVGEANDEVEVRLGVTQQPTPEPEHLSGPADTVEPQHVSEKGEHIEDAGIEPDSPVVIDSSDGQLENDVRLAQSLGQAANISSDEPYYLTFPEEQPRRHIPTTTSFLRPGSKFRGTQQSDRQVYSVDVEIKSVDLSASVLTGYLRIQGLTDDHPTLTTFFEGEIIGPKYLFKTTHPSWGSNEKVDLQHWARFPAWRPLAKQAKNPAFTLQRSNRELAGSSSEHLFMRWKEYFLVPDHRVKTITGASFEGFYYICFGQGDGKVSGIYYHAKSEKYQQLELVHVGDGGCEGAVEFR
ncbi:hypothetical protein LTR62_006042 [Meristemomyces frigidus]|uniref:Uncharacterized protein n=1 Tax=Meristemomyces frigidus TaxID=1508187 RepID=A0AAN7YEW3_9PEZI|nr:hypothetical protein LTR62_006042 [Meristemomyces frigidus]